MALQPWWTGLSGRRHRYIGRSINAHFVIGQIRRDSELERTGDLLLDLVVSVTKLGTSCRP